MKHRLELKVQQANGRYRLATESEIVACAEQIIYAELEEQPLLSSPAAVVEFLKHHYYGLEHEVFGIIFLNTRHRVISFEPMFRGTIDGASVYPREVVKLALARNAAAVVLSHNHPSGVAEPSQADEMITRRLIDALGLLDIRVLDHIVISGATSVSLAERGLV